MRREHIEVELDGGGSAGLIAYGHLGRPLLAFPSDRGRAWDFENNGMVGAIQWLIDAGRLKVYAVDSFDVATWRDDRLSLEERARRHGVFERWITERIVALIHQDCGGPLDIVTTGCSFGAYHAANFCLKRADLFPQAICLSGVYNVATVGGNWERGDAVYFNNPMDYMVHASGEHLEWLRRRAFLVLVCGQGAWEDSTGSLPSTKDFAGLLAAKGVPHELDLWGYDVPHDWPSWRRQLAHHLPRFC